MQWKQETGAGKGSLSNKWNDPFPDMGGKGGTYENVIFLTGWGGGEGGGERKRLAPSPEPLRTAFCAIARN